MHAEILNAEMVKKHQKYPYFSDLGKIIGPLRILGTVLNRNRQVYFSLRLTVHVITV